MRTHSLLLSLSLLASCSSVPAPVAQATDAAPLPGLPAASGPRVWKGEYIPAPEALSRFLLSLPTQDVLASSALRRRYLQGKVLVQELPAQGDGQDHLIVDKNGPGYGFWIRSFHGAKAGLTGYLVQVRGLCADLRTTTPTGKAIAVAAARQCSKVGATPGFDSGMRAYRVIEGQPPEDVTASISPDPAVSKAQRERFAPMGASAVFANVENLDRVPVFRWMVEFDPEQSSTSVDPPVFNGGHNAHAGFIVWNGERFERRVTVPRALWPCRAAGHPVDCPPRSTDGDPFITD